MFMLIIGLFMVLSISPAMAAEDDTLADSGYPKYQGDNRNSGQSPYTGPQNNETKWNYTINSSESLSATPSVGPDGTIYLPTYITQNNDYYKYADLKAINPNGTLKWNYTYKSGLYNYFTGTPSIAKDGTIYAPGVIMTGLDWNGFMLALNPDGTLKWSYINEGDEGWSSPAIGNDGTIYTSGYYQGQATPSSTRIYGILYAINPNGTLKWNYTITEPTNNQGSSYSYAPPAIGPDGTIYFTGDIAYYGITGRLYALNPNGTLKWQKIINPNPSYYTNLRTSPAIANDGTIIIAPFYYNYTDYTSVIYAYNPDGSEKWNFTYTNTWITGLAIANDGTIYTVGRYNNNDKGIVYALKPDGTPKWNYTINYPIYYSPVIGKDGTIYFGDGIAQNTLYALNPDGTVKWSLAVQIVNSPVIGPDGTLYVCINDLDPQLGRISSILALMNPQSNPDDTITPNPDDTITPNPDDTITPDNTPNTGNISNAVNAASSTIKTIGMRKTGLPIAGLVLALLAVFAGGVVPRRK